MTSTFREMRRADVTKSAVLATHKLCPAPVAGSHSHDAASFEIPFVLRRRLQLFPVCRRLATVSAFVDERRSHFADELCESCDDRR